MSRKNYSKEFKLKLLKEHNDQGVSFWKLGKEYGIEASIIRRWWHLKWQFSEKARGYNNGHFFGAMWLLLDGRKICIRVISECYTDIEGGFFDWHSFSASNSLS